MNKILSWKLKKIGELNEQKKQLINYLKSKTLSEDWHAVSDAASDIREINSRILILDLLIEEVKE